MCLNAIMGHFQPDRQEALLAAISEKDANIALLELSSSKKKKTQDEVAQLKREKDRLVQQLKQQVGGFDFSTRTRGRRVPGPHNETRRRNSTRFSTDGLKSRNSKQTHCVLQLKHKHVAQCWGKGSKAGGQGAGP